MAVATTTTQDNKTGKTYKTKTNKNNAHFIKTAEAERKDEMFFPPGVKCLLGLCCLIPESLLHTPCLINTDVFVVALSGHQMYTVRGIFYFYSSCISSGSKWQRFITKWHTGLWGYVRLITSDFVVYELRHTLWRSAGLHSC